MAFQNAASNGQQEAEASSFLVEGCRRRVECALNGAGFGDDDDGSGSTAVGFEPPLGDHRARNRLLTKNSAEDRRECRSKTGKIASHRGARRGPAELEVDISIPGLVYCCGDCRERLKQIEALFGGRGDARIERGNLAELADQRDNSRA